MDNQNKTTKERRRATVLEAYGSIVVMLLLICIGNVLLGFDLKMMIVFSIVFNMLICVRCHLGWSGIEEAIANQIKGMASFLIVMMGIGFLVAGCMVSGMIPLMIAWLSRLISPNVVILLCLIFCSVVAFCIGSVFATIGTIGAVMFSVATLLGANPAIAAAACICGANFGQYISPVADLPNFTASVNKMSTMEFVKSYLPYFGIAFVLTAIFYAVMGRGTAAGVDTAEKVRPIVDIVMANFKPSPLVFLPMIIALVLSVLKFHSMIVVFAAGFVGFILGIVLQGFPFADCINAGYNGFSSDVFLPGVELPDVLYNLLNRGGILSMADTLIFIYLVLVCVSLFDAMGAFDVLRATAFGKAKNPFSLTFMTLVFGTFFGLVTCEPYATVLVTTEVANKPFEQAGYDPKKCAILSNAAAEISAYMAPWSFMAIYLASSLGVTPIQYIPYAALFYLVPVVILVLTFIGFGNKKLNNSEVKAES